MSKTPQTAFISQIAQLWPDDNGEGPGDRPLSPVIALSMNRFKGAAS
ncbi:MAG: hypothetical protein HRU33_03800 [Rhodobacteraceae bacterium]|nr:hypothetical protein [Paracoccaceae bacterium]